VWQYSVVLPGASIGSNVNICSHCFVENDVLIGNNVTIKNGVRIFDGVIIENNVFIGPNVVFTNDKYPKSKVWAHTDLKTHVSEGASIGANAVILPGVSIGKHALVGAGSVVTRSVPDFAVAFGSPAVVKRYAAQRSAPFPEFSAFSGG
jgi:acetyltransferase-like isoleucine patch superfamily enzyme